MEDIYQSCVNAGPDKCALHESSVAGIQARVDAILTRLRTALLSVEAEDGSRAIVDYPAALQVMFSTLYQSHKQGAQLMHALAELEQGNGFPIYNSSVQREINDLMTCNCGETVPVDALWDRFSAIACGDVDDRGEYLEDLRVAYEEMAQISKFAEVWPARMFCA